MTLLGATQQAKRLFVQLDHHVIVAADNQQGRRLHDLQVRVGQVRASAAGNNRADRSRAAGCCHQCGPGAGTGSEVPEA